MTDSRLCFRFLLRSVGFGCGFLCAASARLTHGARQSTPRAAGRTMRRSIMLENTELLRRIECGRPVLSLFERQVHDSGEKKGKMAKVSRQERSENKQLRKERKGIKGKSEKRKQRSDLSCRSAQGEPFARSRALRGSTHLFLRSTAAFSVSTRLLLCEVGAELRCWMCCCCSSRIEVDLHGLLGLLTHLHSLARV